MKIVFRRSDGGISITHVADGEDINIIRTKHVPPDATILAEGDIEIPNDRKDRDCWEFKNGKVEVDFTKLSVKESKKTEKQIIFQKLKITEEEFDKLIK